MPRLVTDPAILAQLEGTAPTSKLVTDPAILAQLEGRAPPPAFPHPTTASASMQKPSPVASFLDAFRGHRGLSENLLSSVINPLFYGDRVDPAASAQQGRVVRAPTATAPRVALDAPRSKGEMAGQFAGMMAKELFDPIAVSLPFKTLPAALAGGTAYGAAIPVAEGLAQDTPIRAKDVALGAAGGAAGGALGYALPKVATQAVAKLRRKPAVAGAPVDDVPPLSTAGAQQVEGAKLDDKTLGEKVAGKVKAVSKLVSPLFGARAVRRLDENANVSPTLKEFRDQIEHRQEFELAPGEVAAPDFTERVLNKTGAFNARLNKAFDTMRTGRTGRFTPAARAKFTADLRRGTAKPADDVAPITQVKAPRAQGDEAVSLDLGKFDEAFIGSAKQAPAPEVAAVPGKAPIGKDTTDAVTGVRAVLDELQAEAQEVGVDLGYTENYFPRVYDVPFLKTEKGGKGLAKVLMDEGIDVEDADDIVSKIIDDDGLPMAGDAADAAPSPRGGSGGSGIGKPSWAKKRGLSFIPDEKLAPYLLNDPRSVLTRYVQGVVKKIEHARIFGAAGGKLEAAIPKIRQEVFYAGKRFTAKDEKNLRGLAQAMEGKYKRIDTPSVSAGVNLVASYQFLRTLSMATLSSLSEPFVALELGGAKAFAKGIRHSIGYAAQQTARAFNKGIPKHETRQALEEMGLVIDNSLADTLQEMTLKRGGRAASLAGEAADASAFASGRGIDLFFKVNMLEPFTNFTRALALHTGEASIIDTIRKLGTNSIMQRRLDELGLGGAEARAWLERTGGKFSQADAYQEPMRMALTRFVNDVVMMPRATTKSLWMSNQRLRLFAQLKSFQGTFGNTVGRRWLHKLSKTGQSKAATADAARVVGAAGLMTFTAALANELREVLQYGTKGDPKRKGESLESKTGRAMDRAGFTGGLQPAVDMLWGQRFGKPGIVQALGPTVVQASSISEAIHELAAKGKSKALIYQIISGIPGYNALPSEKKRELRAYIYEIAE